MGFEGDTAAVIEAMTSRRLEETEGRTQYSSPPLHRIVTIAVAKLDPNAGSFEVGTLGGEDVPNAVFDTVLKVRSLP